MQMTRSLPLYVRLSVTLIVCTLLIGRGSAAFPVDGDNFLAAIEPPERPERFRSHDELNEYLTKLRRYHILASRPRFGRSVDRALPQSASSQDSQSRTFQGASKLWKQLSRS